MTSRFGRPAVDKSDYRLQTTDTMASLRDEWVTIGEGVGHPFATWDWLSLWWRHFGRRRHRLTLVSARGHDGGLIGIVPLYRSSTAGLRVLRFVGHGPSDELGPIIVADSPLTRPELLHAALGTAGRWDVLLGEDMRTGEWMEQVGGRVTRHTSSPILDINGQSWTELLAGKSSRLRQWVRRAERAVGKTHQLKYRLVTDPATLDRDFATLLRLHVARWGGSTSFANPRVRGFHAEFAALAMERGWLRLWFLVLDDQPVAAWYGLRFAGQEWSYQMGRDPHYDNLNVGFVLNNHTLREAVADGVDSYQFLRGSDSYKLRWATRNPGLDTVLASRGPVGRVAVAAAERARWLRPEVRRAWQRVRPAGTRAGRGSGPGARAETGAGGSPPQ